MKKKNFLNLILLSGLLIGAGCSKDGEVVTKGTEIANKPVEIEYWHVASESFGGAAIKELIANFNTNNPELTSGNSFQKISSYCSNGIFLFKLCRK